MGHLAFMARASSKPGAARTVDPNPLPGIEACDVFEPDGPQDATRRSSFQHRMSGAWVQWGEWSL